MSNGKAGYACARSHVQSAVLVARFARRVVAPRTTDLILLDRDGRKALLLSGLLWPATVLEQVIDLMPEPVQRLPGRSPRRHCCPLPESCRTPTAAKGTDDSPSTRNRPRSRTVLPACSNVAMILLPIYRSAVRQFDSRVRVVRPEQWAVSTPDNDWDVHAWSGTSSSARRWSPTCSPAGTGRADRRTTHGPELVEHWAAASAAAVAALTA